jgi:hypothetical protein
VKEDPERRYQLLHQQYVELSGRPWPWSRMVLHRWANLMVATKELGEPLEKALCRVVVEIKRASKELKGYEHHLKFMKITEPTVFCEHWAEAMARSRVRPTAPHLKVVEAFTGRRMEAPTGQAFKDFVKSRDAL